MAQRERGQIYFIEPADSDASSDLTSDLSSTLTSELTLSGDEAAAPSTKPCDYLVPSAKPNDDPAPSAEVKMKKASMVACPAGGRHVIPSGMEEFHRHHCSWARANTSERLEPRCRHAEEDWEAECGELSPLALASTEKLYFRPPSPGLTKGQRRKYYRDLVGDWREARLLQARYDAIIDDERRFSVEQRGDAGGISKGRKQALDVGAASSRNAEPQDVASDPAVAAGSSFGDDDDEAVEAVDEDGTTFYTGRSRGHRRSPPAASPHYAGQWRPG